MARLIRPDGLVEYDAANNEMHALAERRLAGEAEDTLILLEHPPVFTAGRRWKPDHIVWTEERIAAAGAELRFIDRGGSLTFHGPGQLVGYPILDLTRHGKDLHRYLRRLEEVLIRTLHRYGIRGERSAGQTGVWVHGAKIASIGVHVSRWVSRHGLALNVSPDLSAFDLIVPCGLSGIRMTSMAALLKRQVPVQAVAEAVAEQFALVFDCAVQWRSSPEAVLSVS